MSRQRGQPSREVLFELLYDRSVVRVSAIDPATNTEVRMVGDPRLPEITLKRAALRKLQYVLNRDRSKTPGRRA
ncbi:DUF6898 family protein [Roseospira visakhapatnamensis]|uniref:Putative transcriptional regulator n=1 Tax=Roseospira visakhapatnamensis TaxID=390880 RepID=A0A7W6RB07_9PROT|nr:hypothetical protein [Roseospira visakhapatnamensis]MBB4264826.1 putative transcriptional regulator [Roseospira visakhapatnamensis]